MDVLVLGGTRFFGRRLVWELVQHGHHVTIVSRGRTPDDFGNRVERCVANRRDADGLSAALRGRYFDVVYDQIGFTPRDAEALVQALGDRMGRLVFTSSGAVYDASSTLIREDDFRPEAYPVDLSEPTYPYDEGKRQAEAYYVQHASCPVVNARPSFVISGSDDYTGRWAWHVERVAAGLPIGVPSDDHPASFVTAADTARFLRYIGTESTFAGAVNVANPGYYSPRTLARRIGDILGRPPVFQVVGPNHPDLSPYALAGPHRVSSERAAALGFPFSDLDPLLPDLVYETI